MKRLRFVVLVFAVAFATGGALLAQVPPADAIPNWSVPATWSPSQAEGGYRTMVDINDAIPFVAIPPCRIADTRAGQGFSGQAGPGPLVSFTNRNFQISGTPTTLPAPPAGCPAGAIPTGAQAVSIQFTVVFPTSAGNLIAWQAGATQPITSVINWGAGTVALGSGTIIPLSGAGAITLRLNTAGGGQTAEVVLDVNGYFSETFNPSDGTFFSVSTASYTGTGGLGFFNNTYATSAGSAINAIKAGSTNGASGVRGQATGTGSATSGYTFGGKFITQSDAYDAAGVKGAADGDPLGDNADCAACYVAGARGVSVGSYGVLGITSTGGGAVGGINLGTNLYDTQTAGFLGYSTTVGVRAEGAITKSGAVAFTEPHPTDPTKMIMYASLEGPEAGTYFRGKARFQNGVATIAVPETFRIVTDPEGLSIQVTPIGQMATVAVQRIDLDQIVVRGSRNVEFFYTVNGVRATMKDFAVLRDNEDYVPGKPGATMPKAWEPFRARLISNGTFREDGTVNLETAERLGWAQIWAERDNPPEREAERTEPNSP